MGLLRHPMVPIEPHTQETHVVHFETIRIEEYVLANVIKRAAVVVIDPVHEQGGSEER